MRNSSWLERVEQDPVRSRWTNLCHSVSAVVVTRSTTMSCLVVVMRSRYPLVRFVKGCRISLDSLSMISIRLPCNNWLEWAHLFILCLLVSYSPIHRIYRSNRIVGIPFLLFLSLLTVSRLFLYVKLSSIDEYRLTI